MAQRNIQSRVEQLGGKTTQLRDLVKCVAGSIRRLVVEGGSYEIIVRIFNHGEQHKPEGGNHHASCDRDRAHGPFVAGIQRTKEAQEPRHLRMECGMRSQKNHVEP